MPTETAEEAHKRETIETAWKMLAEAEKTSKKAIADLLPPMKSKDMEKVEYRYKTSASAQLDDAEKKLERVEMIAVKYDLFDMEDKCKLFQSNIDSIREILSAMRREASIFGN